MQNPPTRPTNLHIVYRDPAQLHPNPCNARTHPSAQIHQVAASIKQFSFVTPVLVDANDVIVAGHARVAAAKLIGLTSVPTVQVDHLSPAELRAYVIADNKIAQNAGWDAALLRVELEELSVMDLDFSVEVTGFSMGEIDVLIGERVTEPDPADSVPAVEPGAPIVTQPGDLWQLGRHRIFCGDARDPASYACLLGRERVQLAIADAPYNVPIQGHVTGNGKARHAEFAMAVGEMSTPAFTGFLQAVMQQMANCSVDGAVHFHFMDWRHLSSMLSAGDQVYGELLNLCVWAKTNAGMGSFYRSQHELVFVFGVGAGRHINNVRLGVDGRHRSNVWAYPGLNSFGADRQAALAWHPTVKPVRLIADAILDASKRGGLVLDPFGGSGTSLIAAEQASRRARLIELEPKYVDVTIRRWQELTGEAAVHAESGDRFSTMPVDMLPASSINRAGREVQP